MILWRCSNLTMKACRKLLEEDLGLPAKSLADRKDFIQKYVDKVEFGHLYPAHKRLLWCCTDSFCSLIYARYLALYSTLSGFGSSDG